ncbi:MMPL family transporter [Corynebacterium bovis]|uniref:MMPL family transporter n=2 Tax=Corynebacterium bovis TaxID=36808 RepID=UPI0031392384
MFSTWGSVAYRFRRVIPVIVIALVALLYGVLGTQLDDRMSQEGWDDPGSESTRAAQIEQDIFGRDDSGDVIVLVTADRPGVVDSPAVRDSMTRQLTGLAADHPDQISHVVSYFERAQKEMITPDGTSAFAAVGLRGVDQDVLRNFRAVEDDLRAIHVDGATVEIGGATAVADALDEGMSSDISRAELFGLPAVAVLLLLVFGGVVAACMPLIVGVLSILGSMGVLAVLANVVEVNVFAQSVVTLLGLGLAIDYGLFMVSRFREELADGQDVPTAVRNTTATAGKTVVFSAAMVAVALSGLLIFPQAFLKSVAYGAVSAVALAAVLSVAVLPSIFAMLGPNIDRWSWKRHHRTRQETVDSFWGRLPVFAMRHKWVVTVGVCALLLALTAPLAGIRFGGINESYLPPQQQTRVAQDHFNDRFPTFRTDPVKLVIEGDNAAVASVYRKTRAVEGLTGPFQVSRPTKEGTTVLSAGITDRDDNDRIVKQLRDIGRSVPGATVHVAGTPAMEVESVEALLDRLPWMLLYFVAATFILLSLVFGSVILPAKAVIMNMLGTGATLGVLTALFVDGVGSTLFSFTPGPLMSPVLVLIVAIVYGLSTDYEVFLVSRMVEARARGATTPQAIRFGTATTGGIITAAALIMIVVCGAFGFSSIVMMKYIAFGMIAALLLDATIIRMLLVPAVMYLLREDCWWAPRWVHVLSEHVGHHEQLAPPAGAPGGFAGAGAAAGAGAGADAGTAPTTAASPAGAAAGPAGATGTAVSTGDRTGDRTADRSGARRTGVPVQTILDSMEHERLPQRIAAARDAAAADGAGSPATTATTDTTATVGTARALRVRRGEREGAVSVEEMVRRVRSGVTGTTGTDTPRGDAGTGEGSVDPSTPATPADRTGRTDPSTPDHGPTSGDGRH